MTPDAPAGTVPGRWTPPARLARAPRPSAAAAAGAAAARRWRAYAGLLLLVFFARIFDLLHYPPLSAVQVPAAAGEGDVINQAMTLLLAGAAIPLALRNRRRLKTALVGLWPLLLLEAWCWTSVSWAIVPEIALRRVAFSTLVVWIVCVGVVELRSPKAVLGLVMTASGLAVATDWALFVLVPSMAVHGPDILGIHASKNDAGAVALAATIAWTAGAFGARGPVRRLFRAAVALAALGFLALCESRTSLIVLLLSVGVAGLVRHGLRLGRRYFALVAPLAAAIGALAALPFAFLPVGEIFRTLFGDPTFTGRTDIWAFVLGVARDSPWTGVGYGSLWNVGPEGIDVQRGYGVVLQVAEGHSGYFDLMATTGCVGLALGAATLAWPFVRLFARGAEAPFRGAESWGAAAMIAFLAAAVFHNLTESSLFRGAGPAWVLALAAMTALAFAAPARGRSGPGAARAACAASP
ncbi:MAG TPA: O-antigen ligase family protein [Elusimicrobiota bacterium]|nr:O-antigen ligase family protein [Elusimicrobiota bacterium]